MTRPLIYEPPQPEPTDFEDLFDDGLYSGLACSQCGDWPCDVCGGCAGVSCFCGHEQETPDLVLTAGLAPERW